MLVVALLEQKKTFKKLWNKNFIYLDKYLYSSCLSVCVHVWFFSYLRSDLCMYKETKWSV